MPAKQIVFGLFAMGRDFFENSKVLFPGEKGNYMRDRIVRHFLFTVLFMHLLFWPCYSSFGQSNANYDLCSDINHIDVNAPLAVTVDGAENIYIAEPASNSVHIYDMGGSRLRSLKGLPRPVSVAVAPEGDLYVGNSIKGESHVAVYDNNLDYLFKLGSGDGEFKQPTAIAVSPVGKIYVVDRKLDTVKVYYPDGSHDFSFGSQGSGEGQFNSPHSAVADADGNLYVVEWIVGGRITKLAVCR